MATANAPRSSLRSVALVTGLSLAYGVVCALFEAQRSGRGQVVDVAMTDGVISLLAPYYGMATSGMHTEELGTNLFEIHRVP